MFDVLKDYRRVGWDFDQTLIDSANSNAFWRFIEHNPYDQEHYIITFRSGGWEQQVWNDLRSRGSRLEDVHFCALHAVPHEMWSNHTKAKHGLILSLGELKDDPYMLWKGAICAEHGIDVLIDDMTDNVIMGCERYGIAHFHPDDLA